MPTPSNSALIDRVLQNFKSEIRQIKGYTAPPQGHVVAKLNQNENPYDIPMEWKRQILNRMAALEWGRYPDNQPRILRDKLAARFGVNSDQIILGHGSNQLLYLIFTSLISKGDKVVLASPTFSLVEMIARYYQAQLVPVTKNTDFSIPETRFLDAASSARLTFLCSPDNPTGRDVSFGFLESVLKTTSGLVLWDEAYAEFWGKSAIPLIDKYPNLVVARTFSKAFSLAGLRIGVLIAHPAISAEIAKANIPYNLDLFSILVAERLLDETAWMEETVQQILNEREKLIAELKEIDGITPYPSHANFITFSVHDAKTVLKKMEEKGVLIRDMTGYPLLENGLRVTVGTKEENETFLKMLKEIV